MLWTEPHSGKKKEKEVRALRKEVRCRGQWVWKPVQHETETGFSSSKVGPPIFTQGVEMSGGTVEHPRKA